MKQWGLATHLFAADNEDFLPTDGTPNPGPGPANSGWYVELPKQLGLPAYYDMEWRTNPAADLGKSLWICPSNTRRSNTNNLFHYCLNESVNQTGVANQPVKISSLRQTSAIVWLFDSKNLPAVGTPNFVHTNLHSGGAQFTFVDAHAERFRAADYWDFTVNKGRTNNPSLVWEP